jgi:hypothetical protein
MLLMNVYISSSMYYVYHRLTVTEVRNMFLTNFKVKREDNSYGFHYDTLNVHEFDWIEMMTIIMIMKVRQTFMMNKFPTILSNNIIFLELFCEF